jgi:hypothetical protein
MRRRDALVPVVRAGHHLLRVLKACFKARLRPKDLGVFAGEVEPLGLTSERAIEGP